MELDYTKSDESYSPRSFKSEQMIAAIQFIRQGWPLVPLHHPTSTGCSCSSLNCKHIGKHPMNKNGCSGPLRTEESVIDWWKNHPQANIGIITGKETELVVVDIDPRHGGESSLEQLESEFGVFPETLKVRTGGDGYHYYFRYTDKNKTIRNKVNVRPGIDVRADGGYIIAPPSVHWSQKSYNWEYGRTTIAELPTWFEDLICVENKNKAAAPKKEKKLTIHSAPTANQFLGEGNRNNGLLSIAGLLRSKGVELGEIAHILNAINKEACNPPLDLSEVDQITSSISRYQAPEQEEPWPEPRELPETVKIQQMTPEILPQALREWCGDISERMQVPLEFVAGPAIIMFASMIGRRVSVLPNRYDNWDKVPNLWGCLIAPPGSMKSPAISAVLKPLNSIAFRERQKFVEYKTECERQEVISNTEIEALKDALKSTVKNGDTDQVADYKNKLDEALSKHKEKFNIREPRYIVNDATIEKLLTILENNPQGSLYYRDELGGWLESVMKKSGREGDREFFLECWNGDGSFTMDRIARGCTFVDGICLSVFGGIQPGKFSAYVDNMAKGGKSDDGFLQRFQIMLYPDRRKYWKKVDRLPNLDAEKKIEEILEKINQMPLPKNEGGFINRQRLRFSEAAQVEYDRWQDILENRLCCNGMSPIMLAHLSKYRSLMPSLALIFTLIENFSQKDSKFPESISLESTLLAIEWCKLLENHALKAYGDCVAPEMAAAKKLLSKIKCGMVKDGDRCRDIYRKSWTGLTLAEDFEKAAKVLEEYGWMKIDSFITEFGGRSENIRINSKIQH